MMSRTKLLLDVVDDLRSLAESLLAMASAMDEQEHCDEVTQPVDVSSSKTQEIPLETLRARLGEISRAGYTAAIHDLIQKHGATHLSKVDPKEYDSLLKEAEALVNAS